MIYRYRLGFTDTDWGRGMFSGDYYRWASRAWGTWQVESGLPLTRMIQELNLGTPSIEARCHHLARIQYEDEFTVEVGVHHLNGRGMVSAFEFVRARDGALAAYGYFVRRFIDMKTLRGIDRPPPEAEAVFSAMAQQTRLPTYEQRRAEHAAERGPLGVPAT